MTVKDEKDARDGGQVLLRTYWSGIETSYT
jgi:hypothetical protein